MAEDENHEIFLKFLPHTADEAYVRKHFEGGGPSGLGDYKVSSLKGVRLAMDKVSGECRGTGWLMLGEKAEAEWLVEEWNEHPYNHMEGKHVEITHARPTGNWIERPKTEIMCRYGKLCVRADCTFRHPDGWDAEKNGQRGGKMGDAFATSRIVCRNGRHCNRSDCFFAHPDGRDCDPKPAKKSKKQLEDEEAARAIKGAFEEAEKKAEAKSENKKPRREVVQEEAFAEDEGRSSEVAADTEVLPKMKKSKKLSAAEPDVESKVAQDRSKPSKVDPDTDGAPKKKKKSKTLAAAEPGAESKVARESAEHAISPKKKKKQSRIAESAGENCGDASAVADIHEEKESKKKRRREAPREEAEAPIPKTKKKKKRMG